MQINLRLLLYVNSIASVKKLNPDFKGKLSRVVEKAKDDKHTQDHKDETVHKESIAEPVSIVAERKEIIAMNQVSGKNHFLELVDLLYLIDKLNALFRVEKNQLSNYSMLCTFAPWLEFETEAYDDEKPLLWKLWMHIKSIQMWNIESERKRVVNIARKLFEDADISILKNSKDPLVNAKITLVKFKNANSKLSGLVKLSRNCREFLYKMKHFIEEFESLLNEAEEKLELLIQIKCAEV